MTRAATAQQCQSYAGLVRAGLVRGPIEKNALAHQSARCNSLFSGETRAATAQQPRSNRAARAAIAQWAIFDRCADCRHKVKTEHPARAGFGGVWTGTGAESLSGLAQWAGPERKRILNPLSVATKRPSNGGFATDGGAW
jgi:hypothetical protein